MSAISGCGLDFDTLLEEDIQRAHLCVEDFQDLAVGAEAANKAAEYFTLVGPSMWVMARTVVAIGAHTGWGNGVAELSWVETMRASARALGCTGRMPPRCWRHEKLGLGRNR